MLTTLTGNIELFIVFCTALIGVGAYKLITKQNSEQIKVLGDKIDSLRMDSRLEQAQLQSNFQHMNEKQNRIESDTTIMRTQVGSLSESIAKMEIKLQNIEREYYKSESN